MARFVLVFSEIMSIEFRQEMSMAGTPEEKEVRQPAPQQENNEKHNWGPKLFISVLVAILVFFYWLLIYSGGVTVHHG